MKRSLAALLLLLSCSRAESPATPAAVRPSILLVTLDTTRADAIGPEAKGITTPSFNALASRGQRYRFAYATVPQTLPSHASMLTGLYPAGHGVHENARFLAEGHPLVPERLQNAGYRTAAFVSAFAVARRFGLARGFATYDDDFGADRAERTAKETADRALAYLNQAGSAPVFLWVHFYDPHYPYTPPEQFAGRFPGHPYLGEVAFMDEQLGRVVAAFEKSAPGPHAIVVAGDHGEGLGDHGEAQHGNLLYQSTMHVPLVVVGPGVQPGTNDAPVSLRSIAATILDWAGIDATGSLRGAQREPVVAAEAMKPFLDYGWQPQVMAVEGSKKAIMAGRLEVYDVAADPGETRNLAPKAELSRNARAALRDYPLPSAQPPATDQLDDEGRRKLASLGYVASTVKPVIRPDAPSPADMTELFPLLDDAAALFVAERYAEAIPLLTRILAADPTNLDAALRLATAHSSLGHDTAALDAFRRAQAIAPDSADVRTYLALHLARGNDWQRAVPMLEQIIAETPNKVPALEALSLVRERQGRFDDAIALRQKLYTLRAPSGAELAALGTLAMQTGNTPLAVDSFERARAAMGTAFRNDLELGVVLLAAGRLTEARDALDRVPPTHPGHAMALFKRAQVSVLLHEPDAPARIEAARAGADRETRELIARERLFQQ